MPELPSPPDLLFELINRYWKEIGEPPARIDADWQFKRTFFRYMEQSGHQMPNEDYMGNNNRFEFHGVAVHCTVRVNHTYLRCAFIPHHPI